jgi:hypothetical protein
VLGGAFKYATGQPAEAFVDTSRFRPSSIYTSGRLADTVRPRRRAAALNRTLIEALLDTRREIHFPIAAAVFPFFRNENVLVLFGSWV